MHFKKEGCDKKQIALDTYKIERYLRVHQQTRLKAINLLFISLTTDDSIHVCLFVCSLLGEQLIFAC